MDTYYIDKHHDLVEACKQGHRKAQYEVYKQYCRAMLNVGFRILNDLAEAEDVLQESFLDAFTKIGDFRNQSSFGQWLKQIVINNALNKLRSRKAVLVQIENEHLEHVPDEEKSDDEEIIWKVKEVRKAIQELPDGYRIVLSLYLMEGFDHEEIASILQIAESTSRSQYLRAKKKLMELLRQRGIEK